MSEAEGGAAAAEAAPERAERAERAAEEGAGAKRKRSKTKAAAAAVEEKRAKGKGAAAVEEKRAKGKGAAAVEEKRAKGKGAAAMEEKRAKGKGAAAIADEADDAEANAPRAAKAERRRGPEEGGARPSRPPKKRRTPQGSAYRGVFAVGGAGPQARRYLGRLEYTVDGKVVYKQVGTFAREQEAAAAVDRERIRRGLDLSAKLLNFPMETYLEDIGELRERGAPTEQKAQVGPAEDGKAEAANCTMCGLYSGYEDVLLCDGCNSETHLACTALPRVPKGLYYCIICRARAVGAVSGSRAVREKASKLAAFRRAKMPRPRYTTLDLSVGLRRSQKLSEDAAGAPPPAAQLQPGLDAGAPTKARSPARAPRAEAKGAGRRRPAPLPKAGPPASKAPPPGGDRRAHALTAIVARDEVLQPQRTSRSGRQIKKCYRCGQSGMLSQVFSGALGGGGGLGTMGGAVVLCDPCALGVREEQRRGTWQVSDGVSPDAESFATVREALARDAKRRLAEERVAREEERKRSAEKRRRKRLQRGGASGESSGYGSSSAGEDGAAANGHE